MSVKNLTFVNNNPPPCDDDFLNSAKEESNNAVTSSGQSLTGIGDTQQLAKGISNYAASGAFYGCTNTGDAYTLSPISPFKGITGYKDGQLFRFRPSATNTTQSPTANINTQGVKNITKADGSTQVEIGDIDSNQDIELRYDLANDVLVLPKIKTTSVIPTLYIGGLKTENDSGDTAHDIKFNIGSCRDIADTQDIVLNSALVKQIDAVWTPGTGVGGRASGVALSASTTYHMFVIAKPDGTADCGFDTALNATNLLADATGYTKYRKVGSIITDSSSNIILYEAYPTAGGSVKYLWKTPILDFNVNDPGTSAVLFSLTAPTGIKTDVLFNALCKDAPAAPATILYFSSPDATDQAPSLTVSPLANIGGVASALQEDLKKYEVTTNTSSQIRMRVNQSGSGLFVRVATLGYTDRNVD